MSKELTIDARKTISLTLYEHQSVQLCIFLKASIDNLYQLAKEMALKVDKTDQEQLINWMDITIYPRVTLQQIYDKLIEMHENTFGTGKEN